MVENGNNSKSSKTKFFLRRLEKKLWTHPKLLAETSGVRVEDTIDANNPVEYWSKEWHWPKEYFEQDNQTRVYLTRDFDEESWLEKYWWPNMKHLLARKKLSSSLCHIQSESSSPAPGSNTPSNQKPQEERSVSYSNTRYVTLLATKSSFLRKGKDVMTEESKALNRMLLQIEQKVPEDSLFRDDLFEDTCEEIMARNEAKVIQDIL